MRSLSLPPNYALASIAVSIGGFLNGYDTGSIGGVTAMSQFTDSIGSLSSAMLGITVSLIMLAGAVPAPFAGFFADRFGRVKIILAGAVLRAAGAITQGTAMGLTLFLAGRVLAGLGEGVFLSVISVYICEIAPVKRRGVLAGMPQFMATAGVCIGYFTCYGSVHMQSSMAWRFPYVVQGVISGVLGLCCRVLPDSPRWLMLHGRQPDALKALRWLNISMNEAQRDILTAPAEQQLSLSLWQSIALLFRPGYRSRTILALFVLGMVQLSGIDGVLYYAPILFAQAGLSSDTASFLASGVSAVLMLAISVPAFLLVDRWGRRTSAIAGGLTLSGCMFLMGALYAAGVVTTNGFARWVVIIAVFVFGLTYCSTWGIVGKIYASEIQSGHTRAAANCIAQGLNYLTNWLVAILTPILLDKSAFGAYFLFGGLALGTVAVLAAYMPETRGRSLEDIQRAFYYPKTWSIRSIMGQFAAGNRRLMRSDQRSDGDVAGLDAHNSIRNRAGATGEALPATPRIGMS